MSDMMERYPVPNPQRVHVVYVLYGSPQWASRVWREALLLRNDSNIRVSFVAITDEPEEICCWADVHHIKPAQPLVWLPRPLRALWRLVSTALRLARSLEYLRPALICCHSLAPLIGASLAAKRVGARLIYEPHELETDSGQRSLQRACDRFTERLLIHRADAVVVVSDSIADWYARTYRIARPVVVRNVPDVHSGRPIPAPALWRDRFGIGADEIIFIYQGKLTRGRRIEQLLRVFARAAPDRHLVVMGFGDLTDKVKASSAACRNIHFAPAVPPSEILCHTAGADVGIHGGENICLSYYYSLPNKFFEYLWAGIGVIVPNWPEVQRIVDKEQVGWVVHGDSDETWLAAINNLTWTEINRAKLAALAAAPNYSWETEVQKLEGVYRRCLS